MQEFIIQSNGENKTKEFDVLLLTQPVNNHCSPIYFELKNCDDYKKQRGRGYNVIYGIIRLSKLINVDAYKRSKVSVNCSTLVDTAGQTPPTY